MSTEIQPQLANLPKPNPEVVSQVPGTARQEPPHQTIELAGDAVDVVSKGASVIRKHGRDNVVTVVFLFMFVVGGWFIRSDYRTATDEDRKAFEKVVQTQSEAFRDASKINADLHYKIHTEHREDAKAERAANKESLTKIWQIHRELRDEVKETNKLTQEQNGTAKALLVEIRKLTTPPKP